jgi:Na+/glutamate symporter
MIDLALLYDLSLIGFQTLWEAVAVAVAVVVVVVAMMIVALVVVIRMLGVARHGGRGLGVRMGRTLSPVLLALDQAGDRH